NHRPKRRAFGVSRHQKGIFGRLMRAAAASAVLGEPGDSPHQLPPLMKDFIRGGFLIFTAQGRPRIKNTDFGIFCTKKWKILRQPGSANYCEERHFEVK
ncbi:hypothetical protein, partial [Oscillibacter sp.]|uniref:hypothetical protein n=1 Tax=Oscillibacter sp. TaxID=1945593 RepID=UPI0028A246A4